MDNGTSSKIRRRVKRRRKNDKDSVKEKGDAPGRKRKKTITIEKIRVRKVDRLHQLKKMGSCTVD